jgi:hypothetical protein
VTRLVVRPGPLLGSRLVPLARGSRTAGSVVVAPSYAPDVANVALDLLIDGEGGVWHLPNAGLVALPRGAAVGASCVLGTARGMLMPTLEDALARATDVPVVAPEIASSSDDVVTTLSDDALSAEA